MVNLHGLHTFLLGIKTPWPCVAKRGGLHTQNSSLGLQENIGVYAPSPQCNTHELGGGREVREEAGGGLGQRQQESMSKGGSRDQGNLECLSALLDGPPGWAPASSGRL